MNKLKSILILAMAFLLLFPLAAVFPADKITIAGDPCSAPLISRLAEAYSKKHEDFKADISTFSCTQGVYRAADGEFMIGVSTQNGLSSDLPKGATTRAIAKSPIVLVVNKGNPVNDLSYKDLQGIYSGRITNWKDVGGKDLEIKNVMLEPCVKHTLSKQVIMYGDGIKQLLPEKKVNPVEYTDMLVKENEGAIGQQVYGYESNNVKVLKIDGVLPDEETLPEDYIFYQDYNVVTHGEPEGAVKEFIDFVTGKEGREIIRSAKHIPVP